MSLPFMRFLLARDLAAAETEIGASVPIDLPDRLDGFLQFRIADVETEPAVAAWLGRAIVVTEVDGRRRIVGSVGFHAPPDADGRVEVGYHTEPQDRRTGVASEAVGAMFDWATQRGARQFRAAVAQDNVASLAVVARLGFRRADVQLDDLGGTEIIFDLDRWPVEPVDPAGAVKP